MFGSAEDMEFDLGMAECCSCWLVSSTELCGRVLISPVLSVEAWNRVLPR